MADARRLSSGPGRTAALPAAATTRKFRHVGGSVWHRGGMKTPLDLGPFVEALQSTNEVSAHVRLPHGFDVVPGSPAEAEFARQSLYAGPWSDEPLAETMVVGNMLVYAAEDQLRSAGELIGAGDSRYGPFTLLRSAFELSAQAWWVFDPGIDLEERLCRGANFHLYSHREHKKLEVEMGASDTRTAKINEILDTARHTGLGVTQSKKASPPWVRHPPKDATSLCRAFMQDSSDPSSTMGAVIYRYLSATPHGTLHGLLRSGRQVPGMPAGQIGALTIQEVDPHELAMFTAGVLVAYITAAQRQMAYLGWIGPAWDSWKVAVRDRIRGYLPDGPS